MDCIDHELNILFLPYFASSHITLLVDMARLFAARGVNITIVTTPCNALLFQPSVDRDVAAGSKITVKTLKFPSEDVGLPEGIENYNAITSMEMGSKVNTAIGLLKDPMKQMIRNCRPDCIVSDMFFPWTVDIADELKIPRIGLTPSNFFFLCVTHSLKIYAPHEKVQSETETFFIPGLPDKIEMKRSELPDHVKTKTAYGTIIDAVREADYRSYGTIVNSFDEFEHNYIEHMKRVFGIKGWALGPLCHFFNKEKTDSSKNSIADRHSCLSWLDNQKPDSVLYACFGSMVRFSDSQLTEIALALEGSKHPFVWVVKKRPEAQEENWLPEGFEERNNGVIIRDWAPQVLILEHPAIGGFLTHSGAGSVLESVTAGVPMITWPLYAEQFYNEKLTNQALKIGIEVGTEVWNLGFEIRSPLVGRDKIEIAITFLMGGSEEAEEMRRRAKQLSKMAKKAVEEGGSSFSDLTALIDELKSIKACGGLEKTNHK